MKQILIAIVLLVTGHLLFPTNREIIKSGSVEFEKTINMYAVYRKSGESHYESYVNRNPQFLTQKSTLRFNQQGSLFRPHAGEQKAMLNSVVPFPFAGEQNRVYTDFDTDTRTTAKTVFEEEYLIKDSIRKIDWKLTDEFRDIAGFRCRRANALILDSIYVVAFYTDEIHVSGGPDAFSGLPGMILTLALPHDHVIWRATQVTVEDVNIDKAEITLQGKPVSKEEFQGSVMKSLKNINATLRALYIRDFMK